MTINYDKTQGRKFQMKIYWVLIAIAVVAVACSSAAIKRLEPSPTAPATPSGSETPSAANAAPAVNRGGNARLDADDRPPGNTGANANVARPTRRDADDGPRRDADDRQRGASNKPLDDDDDRR